MADLSSLPSRPLTDAELEALDTSGWTRYECRDLGNAINRFTAHRNQGFCWRGDELWGNVTPQTEPLDIIQAIFYKDMENGCRWTQPVELVPTEAELHGISERRESMRKYRAEKVAI